MIDMRQDMGPDGGAHRAAEPQPIGSLTLADGLGVAYSCWVFPARAPVRVADAAFAFSRLEGIWPQPVFIGWAGAWPLRLGLHPMREAALTLGAIHILVHRPDPDDPVPARAAAERLIAWHRPVLNAEPARVPPALAERGLAAARPPRKPA